MMELFWFLTGFVSGSISIIVLLVIVGRMVRNHQLRPRGSSGENSIMETGETVVSVLNPRERG